MNPNLSGEQFRVEQHPSPHGTEKTLAYVHPDAPGNPDRGLERGWAGALTYWDRGDHLQVFSRVTDADYRRRGVASALQDHLEAVAGGRPITSRDEDMSSDASRFHAAYVRKNPTSTWTKR